MAWADAEQFASGKDVMKVGIACEREEAERRGGENGGNVGLTERGGVGYCLFRAYFVADSLKRASARERSSSSDGFAGLGASLWLLRLGVEHGEQKERVPTGMPCLRQTERSSGHVRKRFIGACVL